MWELCHLISPYSPHSDSLMAFYGTLGHRRRVSRQVLAALLRELRDRRGGGELVVVEAGAGRSVRARFFLWRVWEIHLAVGQNQWDPILGQVHHLF